MSEVPKTVIETLNRLERQLDSLRVEERNLRLRSLLALARDELVATAIASPTVIRTIDDELGTNRKPLPERVRRREDMSPDGTLELIREEDGDIIVAVRESGEKGFGSQVQFCTSQGGGSSFNTWIALCHLMRAMQEDNDVV